MHEKNNTNTETYSIHEYNDIKENTSCERARHVINNQNIDVYLVGGSITF